MRLCHDSEQTRNVLGLSAYLDLHWIASSTRYSTYTYTCIEHIEVTKFSNSTHLIIIQALKSEGSKADVLS